MQELLKEREEQVLALTEEKREELESQDDCGDSNPILHAEAGPNRFYILSAFFTDSDGVQIQEDLDLNELTVKYFTNEGEIELTEGTLYDWAVSYYKEKTR